MFAEGRLLILLHLKPTVHPLTDGNHNRIMAQSSGADNSAFYNRSGSQFIGTNIRSETVNIGGKLLLVIVSCLVSPGAPG